MNELNELLVKAVRRELQVSIQYIWQAIVLKQDPQIKTELRKISIAEMKHAEMIARRLNMLGQELPVEPDPIVIGSSLSEMANKNIQDEQGAIELYEKIIQVAEQQSDEITKRMFEHILKEEKEHHEFFKSLLNQNENKIEEKTQGPGQEKHVPLIEIKDNGVLVKVGEVEHPMLEEHYIQWVELQVDNDKYKKHLNPGQKPQAFFEVSLPDKAKIVVRSFCTIHGIWKAELKQ